jgi:hypothetical protein
MKKRFTDARSPTVCVAFVRLAWSRARAGHLTLESVTAMTPDD